MVIISKYKNTKNHAPTAYVPAITCFASVYDTNTMLDTLRIFSKIGPARLVDAWPRFGSIDVKCLSQSCTKRIFSKLILNENKLYYTLYFVLI